MNVMRKLALILGGGVLAFAATMLTAEAANSLEIVIATGPHAGTYQLPAGNIACMCVNARKQSSAAYKDPQAQRCEERQESISSVRMIPARDGARSISGSAIRQTSGRPLTRHPCRAIARVTCANKGSTAEVAFEGRRKTASRSV